jgi:hypothetical protein
MKELRFICAQPAIKYYAWQIEVLINNFIKNGINPNQMDILCAVENNVIPEEFKKLADTYPVRFFFYNDTRANKIYIPSIYFNLMKQHIAAHPEIQNDVLFLHDADIVFTKKPNFDELIHGSSWYISDTKLYINYDYIQQKGNHIYEKMCEIIGIDKLIPKLMNSNSGGAQYIVKDTNFEFWNKVEKDSIKLYEYFCDTENLHIKKDRYDYAIQKWTAGMWSFLWNAWYFGHETLIDKKLDFGWVTDSYDYIEKYCILHNAGVTNDTKSDKFFKTDYINEYPYGKDINVSEKNASYFYWQEICKTAKKSCLIENSQKVIFKPKSIFDNFKIDQMQLDPFGVCNAKCWYCPVKYNGNSAEGREVMSPELLEKIIKNMTDERNREDGLVSKNFGGFYTAHYNEILLYPHYEKFLEICNKYGMCSMILSNGMALTPEKVDLIKKYKHVVNGICLNIPAFDVLTWSKRSGFDISLFDKLMSNIKYAMEVLPEKVHDKSFSIQINCVNKQSFVEDGGWLTKGYDFPQDIDLDLINGELVQQEKLAKSLFLNLNIFTVPSLIDRAGLLNNVISNKWAIERYLMKDDKNRKVIGCGNGREVGGRPIGWLHVNAAGDAFLCCNDYNFSFKFGNFKTQELRDFWGKEEHQEKIKKAYETICRDCASAVFE